MTIGDPQAGHIDIVVTRTRGSAESIAIHLHRVGAPGSRFTLSIGGRPVVAPFILSETQCRFDAVGSLCDLAIGPKGSARSGLFWPRSEAASGRMSPSRMPATWRCRRRCRSDHWLGLHRDFELRS